MERPPRRPHRETPVVPLHAHRPPQQPLRTIGGLALAEPAAPAAAPSSTRTDLSAVGRGARARRATAERNAHDGWTFIVVPPGVGARPRTLHVSVRRFRVAAWTIVTLAGTGVLCGALLTFLLSVAPAVQDEAAGVELGLFEDRLIGAPRTVQQEVDLLSLLAIGPAAATVATPTAREAAVARSERPLGPRADVARAKAERRRVIAAPSVSGERERTISTAAMSAEGMPVIGRITSRFTSSRRHPVLGVVRPHRGVDIAAASGTPISAPAAGRVVFSGRKFGFGNVVEIDHGQGVITRYAHCRTLSARRGEYVAAGEVIATVGRTGLASGPHLHFEVLVDGRSVDPLKERVEDLVSSRTPAGALPMTNVFVPGMPPAVLPGSSEAASGDSTSAAGGT